MKPNYALRREREFRGWSHVKVAELIGTDAVTVGRWERGVSFPYPHFREQLCALFGKSMQELGLLSAKTEEQRDESIEMGHNSQGHSRTFASVPIYDPATPLPLTSPLIGRENLLAMLEQRLCEKDSTRFTALYGLPGVGKTSLATHIAHHQLRDHFPDGVLWAGLGPQANALAHLSHWGTLLGVHSNDETPLTRIEDWTRVLRTAIGMRRLLFVIDDAWESNTAFALRVGGPACAYLLTTRFPQIALLFADNGAISVPELAEHDGLNLLTHYASDMMTAEPALAQKLVKDVGGLPLALTLMGKYLRMQGYGGLQHRRRASALRLQDAKERLHLALPHASPEAFPSLKPSAPLSLQSVIGVSIESLPEQVQRAFYALSAFPAKPASFSDEAAVFIIEEPPEVLDLLCDTGLLESNEPQRYMLHQTLTDYAHVHQADRTVTARMIRYYMDYIKQNKGDEDALEREMTNILHALRAAQEQGFQVDHVQGILTLAPYFAKRGLHSITHQYLFHAYTVAKEQQNIQVLVDVLLHLGEGAIWQGEQLQAEQYLQEGLILAQAKGDAKNTSAFLSFLGFTHMQRGHYIQAEQLLQEGLGLASQEKQLERCATILRHLGLVAMLKESFDSAEIYLQQGLTYAREVQSTEQLFFLLVNLGMVAGYQKNFLRAEEFYAEALSFAQQMKSLDGLTAVHNNLGQLARLQGCYAKARCSFQEALSLSKRSGNGHLQSLTLLYLAELAIEQQEYLQAEQYCQDGLSIARRLELREVIMQLLTSLKKTFSAQGKIGLAEQACQEAAALAQYLGISPTSCDSPGK